MSQPTPSTDQNHGKKPEENHDDCDDCKREKKQNEFLIKIYERLQQVRNKSSKVKSILDDHRSSSASNRTLYMSLSHKINDIPKIKKLEQNDQMQKLGFQVAADIFERQNKNSVIKQNQRLKQVIARMQKERYNQRNRSQNKSEVISERKISMPKVNESFCQKKINESSIPNESRNSQIQKNSQIIAQNTSTKSTSFNSTRFKKNIDIIKNNGLNLWLYENEKHAKLQSQLYRTRMSNEKPIQLKRGPAVLPALRNKGK